MRAVVVAGPRRLALESVPDPTPGPGQAVLRVSACGICGSDLQLHQAGLLPAGSILASEKDDFQHTVDLLEPGRIQPGPMLTEHSDLAGVPGTFDALEHPTGRCKLLVLP